jgi:O-antigen ligase
MSIIAVLSWSYLFLEKINLLKKLFMAMVLLGLSLNIVLSNARQGILTLLASLSIFTLVIVFKKNKFLGIAGVIVFGIVSIISIAGMLQSGPLEKLLYKDSVSLRGYYWRAGVNMFLNNPLFGVGIERYGANFKFYRDSGYANTYGYDLISTNAHNVPIQFFATGGIFVGIAYLAIQLLVLSVAIKRLRSMRGDNFIFYLGILCAWIAFQFQSLVSIDNIGLTIWGWLFAGCLVGASVDSHDEISIFKSRRSTKLIALAPIKPIISGILLAATLVFVLFLSKGESNMMEARNRYNPTIKDDSNAVKVLAQQIISDPLSQPAYKLEAANYLIQSGYEEEGLAEFERLAKQNRIHPTFLIPLASMYEYKGRYEEAIKVREQVKIYDPHNLNNYLQLARLYKDTNDMTKALEMKLIVINQAPNSPQAKSAQEEINF